MASESLSAPADWNLPRVRDYGKMFTASSQIIFSLMSILCKWCDPSLRAKISFDLTQFSCLTSVHFHSNISQHFLLQFVKYMVDRFSNFKHSHLLKSHLRSPNHSISSISVLSLSSGRARARCYSQIIPLL